MERKRASWAASWPLPTRRGPGWNARRRGRGAAIPGAESLAATSPATGRGIADPTPFTGSVDENGLRALAGSPHVGNLPKLSLQGNSLTPAGVAALLASPNLGQLRELSLSGCEIRPPGLKAFLSPSALRNLR